MYFLWAILTKIRTKGFSLGFIMSIPSKEVHFPPEVVFPFALAAEVALRTLADTTQPEPAPQLQHALPFGDEAQEDLPESSLPRYRIFKITLKRILDFGGTPWMCFMFQPRQ